MGAAPFSIRWEMRELVYADNAATTRLDESAYEAMKPFFLDYYSNPSQPYSFSRSSKKAIRVARETIAKCVGADPEEIYFTSCGTESDNWAIKMGAGDHGDIITSAIEHHAILNSCKSLERVGRQVAYAPVNRYGVIDKECLEKSITDNTRLVSIMFANNEIGSIQPVAEIAHIAHKHRCLFHTDAVQAVGHININVQKMGIDLLSASAHKFNGPKGIGFLFMKKGVRLSSYMDGGSQESGNRAGTENVAFIVGMATALQKNCEEIASTGTQLLKLEERLISGLKRAGIVFIRNGADNHIPGNISLSFRGCEGETLLHRLDLMGICVSTGSACDNVNTQISHVIKAINVPEEYATGTIRISLGKYNTEEDVEKIVEALRKIIKR